MKNIVLVCSAGMTTSLLVKKMEKYTEEIGYEAQINAYSISEVSRFGKDADIILLGPQVRFNLEKVKKEFPDKVVDVIDMRDYGTMNGEKVINKVKELIG